MDLSIIIPMYNHEKYVKQCLDSILENLNPRIEVIVVDDASTDKSLKIVQQIKKDYPALKIIKNENNMGCAASLNVGIEAAKGKYIGINSSDDYVDKDYYNKLLELALKEGADVVCANMATFNENSSEVNYGDIYKDNIVLHEDSESPKEPHQVEADILLGHWTASSGSTKIILKELYVRYPFSGNNASDLSTIYPILAASKKIFFYPNLYKYYRETVNSVSRVFNIDSNKSVIDSISLTLDLLGCEEFDPKYKLILFTNNSLAYLYCKVLKVENIFDRSECLKYFYDNVVSGNKEFISTVKHSEYLKRCIMINHIDQIGEEIIDFVFEGEIQEAVLMIESEKENKLLSQIEHLETEKEILLQETENLQNHISAMTNSRSWRITAPLRRKKRG